MIPELLSLVLVFLTIASIYWKLNCPTTMLTENSEVSSINKGLRLLLPVIRQMVSMYPLI
jgi:hypothetical protein